MGWTWYDRRLSIIQTVKIQKEENMNFLNKNHIICIITILFMGLLISCTNSVESAKKDNKKSGTETSTSTTSLTTTTVQSTKSETELTTTKATTSETVTSTTTQVTTTCTEATTTFYAREPGELLKTYCYDNETKDDTSKYLLKTEYYENCVALYFTDSEKLKNESINVYSSDLIEIYDKIEYSVQDDVMTIYNDKPEKISGITISRNSNSKISIRYLDSERYEILEYKFLSDIGMIPAGNGDGYYTQDEIDAIVETKFLKEEKLERALSKIAGIWEDPEQKHRVEIYVNDQYIFMYMKENGEWVRERSKYVYDIWVDYNSDGAIIVNIQENGATMIDSHIIFNDDLTEMELHEHPGILLYRIQE